MPHHFEIIFRPEIQDIFDHFCGLMNVRIAFYSPNGEELRVGNNQNMCSYCHMIRRKLGYDFMCQTLDVHVRQEVAKTGILKSYTCHGGMIEAVMPVVVCGRLLGFIMIGQFRQRKAPPCTVLKKTSPALRRKLHKTFREAPNLTPRQVKHTLGIFEMLVRYISEKHLVNADDTLQSLIQRLQKFPESRLSLQQASALVGYSPTALSRLFRKKLGKSYIQMKTQLLLEKANSIFKEHPGIKIQDVAYQLGFDDPLYFSRLYRKKSGERARDAARRLSG